VAVATTGLSRHTVHLRLPSRASRISLAMKVGVIHENFYVTIQTFAGELLYLTFPVALSRSSIAKSRAVVASRCA
jgi:hypothetical protein